MIDWDTTFLALLTGFDTASFGATEGAVYGLWPDFRLGFLNAGWRRFVENTRAALGIGDSRALGIGEDALLAVPRPWRGRLRAGLERCSATGRPWGRVHEWGEETRAGHTHVQAYPIAGANGYLVLHSRTVRVEPVVEGAPDQPSPRALYEDEGGLIIQCIHCRRVRRQGPAVEWDWVPEWALEPPANASGSLCGPCFDFHYGGARPPARRA